MLALYGKSENFTGVPWAPLSQACATLFQRSYRGRAVPTTKRGLGQIAARQQGCLPEIIPDSSEFAPEWRILTFPVSLSVRKAKSMILFFINVFKYM